MGKGTIEDPSTSGKERLVKPADDMLVTDPSEFIWKRYSCSTF